MENVVAFLLSDGMIATYVTIAIVIALQVVMKRIYLKKKASEFSHSEEDKRRNQLASRIYVTVKYLVIALAAILILQFNGINVTTLAASLGIAGIVVGFALQDALKDIVTGVHILTDRFYTVGDVVCYHGSGMTVTGEVISITPQTTKVRSLDDLSVVSISNRNVSEVTLVGDLNDLDIPLPYELSQFTAKSVLEQACSRIKKLANVDDCLYKGVQKFGDSAIEYRVRIFCKPVKRNDALRDARSIILETIEEAGISIPYNRVDVALTAGTVQEAARN